MCKGACYQQSIRRENNARTCVIATTNQNGSMRWIRPADQPINSILADPINEVVIRLITDSYFHTNLLLGILRLWRKRVLGSKSCNNLSQQTNFSKSLLNFRYWVTSYISWIVNRIACKLNGRVCALNRLIENALICLSDIKTWEAHVLVCNDKHYYSLVWHFINPLLSARIVTEIDFSHFHNGNTQSQNKCH